MGDIKTKEFANTRFSTDTVIDLGDRMRRGLMKPPDYARNLADDGQVSSTEYASDQFQCAADGICYEAGHIVVGTVKNTFRSARKTNNHIGAHRKADAPDVTPQKRTKTSHTPNIQKADEVTHQTIQATGKASIKTAQIAIKDSPRALKASQEATKTSTKTARQTARAAEKTARTATATVKKTAELLLETAKAIAAAAKAVAATVEEIAAAIAAGGWVALVIIAVIIIILVIIIAIIGYVDPSVANPK